MPDFVNRKDELEWVCGQSASSLITFYGEADIGKTSLLNAAEDLVGSQSPSRIVARVDFEDLPADQAEEPSQWVLRSLVASNPGLAALQEAGDKLTADLVAHYLGICDPPPVLMFDTTEKLQTNVRFWEWLETALVRPLLMDGRVRLVFAGRVPTPWRDYDVRRQNQLHRLEPLSTQDDLEGQGAARDLIRKVLRQSDQTMSEADIKIRIELILRFSHGHPGLSEKLANWVIKPGAGRWPATNIDQLRNLMAEDRVKEYIDQFLFKEIDPDWRLILWWASILDWFDTAVLRQYLEALAAVRIIRAARVPR